MYLFINACSYFAFLQLSSANHCLNVIELCKSSGCGSVGVILFADFSCQQFVSTDAYMIKVL